MKIILQRVNSGTVTVDGKLISSIDQGFVLFVGIAKTDSEINVLKLAKKIANFRVFGDVNDKMNLTILDVNANILSVPQFTIMGATCRGNRPGFDNAAEASMAKNLWKSFNEKLREFDIIVKEGVFGAHMHVNIDNNGPVTFVLEDNNIG